MDDSIQACCHHLKEAGSDLHVPVSPEERGTERRRHHCHETTGSLKLNCCSLAFELKSDTEAFLRLGLRTSSFMSQALSFPIWKVGGIMIPNSQASFRARIGTFSPLNADGKYFKALGPNGHGCGYSTLPLCLESSCRNSKCMGIGVPQ